MKLLYLSCHSVLEYDELKLFEEMGIDWFSLGSYINPQHPHDTKRPPIDAKIKEHFQEIALQYDRDNLSPELIAWADVIMVMHIPEWITKNLEKLKGKTVIWRTIGQSSPWIERDLAPYRDRLKIVRYSPTERTIPGFIGEDAMIRFPLNPDEFCGWNGDMLQVMSLIQSPVQRGQYVRIDLLNQVTDGFSRVIWGTDTEQMSWGKGRCSYEDMKKELQNNRAFFYSGTYPASYTIGFMEAWMTGIPVIALGHDLASPKELTEFYNGMAPYEVHELIQDGVNGFVSDNIVDLRNAIDLLLKDKSVAQRIGQEGRKKAIELFGKETIRQQWSDFFKTL